MTNKLNLKRTPEEALQHRLRKERKRAKRGHSSHSDLKPQAATSSKRSHNNKQDAGPSRKWASSDEDDEAEYGPQPANSKTHAEKPGYDALKTEIEQEMFRQKMFDAMGDDERLDSIEAQFNDFAQIPDRWRTSGTGKNKMNIFEEDGYVKMDPRYMDDEEYAEWIRIGMYRYRNFITFTYHGHDEKLIIEKLMLKSTLNKSERKRQRQHDVKRRRHIKQRRLD